MLQTTYDDPSSVKSFNQEMAGIITNTPTAAKVVAGRVIFRAEFHAVKTIELLWFLEALETQDFCM